MKRCHVFDLAILIAMLSISAAGCTPSRTITIETKSDPGYAFAGPGELVVALGSVPATLEGEDLPVVSEAVFDPVQMSMDQRIVRSDLDAALRSLGFAVTEDAKDAAMVWYFTETYRDHTYDSYERVPVTQTSIGFGWGRGHSHDFYSTTHSSVVVPVTRTERLGTIWLAATPTERAHAPSSADRSPSEIAVWMGMLTTDAADVQANRVSHIRQLLSFWGQTTRTVVDVPVNP